MRWDNTPPDFVSCSVPVKPEVFRCINGSERHTNNSLLMNQNMPFSSKFFLGTPPHPLCLLNPYAFPWLEHCCLRVSLCMAVVCNTVQNSSDDNVPYCTPFTTAETIANRRLFIPIYTVQVDLLTFLQHGNCFQFMQRECVTLAKSKG